MAKLDTFLQLVADQRASDLHFHAGKRPMVRLFGELLPVPFRVLSAAEAKKFIHEVLNDTQRRRLVAEQQLDFIYALPGVARFRGSICEQEAGLSAVFRVINEEVPSLEDLMLPPVIERLCDLSSGLVLATGPTGSGKSTTLAAMVRRMNERQQRHILTIEEPVEYIHPTQRSLITQREVGRHVNSFASALRSALREAPDVIVVGELREEETIRLALTAAETGILVLGTLHTNSAAKSVTRLLEVFDANERDEVRGALSLVLRGVIAQTLVPRLREQGRVAAVEVLVWNEAVSHMIREGKVHQLESYLRSQGRAFGMHDLEDSLAELVRRRQISVEAAVAASNDPRRLQQRIHERRQPAAAAR